MKEDIKQALREYENEKYWSDLEDRQAQFKWEQEHYSQKIPWMFYCWVALVITCLAWFALN